MSNRSTVTAEQLKSLLAKAREEQMDDAVVERLSAILHFAEHAYSISDTCRTFGISRSTFHRWMERFDPQDIASLADKSHESLMPRQSTVAPETVDIIRRYRMRYPHMGKERIAELLMSEYSTEISASTVGRIIERECLYLADTPFHWKKRLQSKTDGAVVTTTQSESEVSSAEHVAIEPEGEKISISEQVSIPSVALTHKSAGITITWSAMLRFIVVVSVLTNFVFAGLLLLSAAVEKNVEKNMRSASEIQYQLPEPAHAAASDSSQS